MFALAWPVLAGNIDATYNIAKGYNNDIGRINFGVTTGDVTVTDTKLTGYAWSENYGWINLAPTNGGVVNTAGVLSGTAWNPNIGWINFAPTNGGVTIDADGYFHGFAWSSLLGWISFNCADNSSCGTYNYKVRTSWSSATIVSNPVFSQNGGAIRNTVPISITVIPQSSSIYYLIDSAQDPDQTSNLYTGTFTLSTGEHTVKAIGVKTGLASSSITTATFTVTGGSHTPIVPPPSAIDVCPNLPEVQATVPSGYTIVGTDCVVDVCPNLVGAQATMPVGKIINDVGVCVDIQVDVCLNIVGEQLTIPVGMTKDKTGDCVKIPDDICPNIPDIQSEIPVGMTKDETGSCVEIVNDLCPNLTGVQKEVPDNMTIDLAGNCVTIPSDVCPNISGTQESLPDGMEIKNGKCVDKEIIPPPDIVPPPDTGVPPVDTGKGTGGDTGSGGSGDVCPNLDGFQSEVPDDYKIDKIGNCVPIPSLETVNVIEKVSTAVVTSVTESYQATAKAVVATAKETKRVINTPTGSITTKAITTAGVAVSGATAVTAIFLNPMSFAEIFLIPFRLWALLLSFLGLRRRNRPWGTVYDSITKQPLDPAYVELLNNLGVEVSTSITDLDGRYGFFTSFGTYKILAHKTNYIFPSKRLAGQVSDELYDNLYFGEEIKITTEGEMIAKNIPLDPEKFDWNETAKKNMNVMRFYSKWEIWIKRITNVFFYIGIVISAVAVWAAPYPYNIIVFALYIIMALLRFFGIKPKYFGWVLDKETGFPLAFALIKVYSVDLERELTKKACDSTGRYYALVPPGNYYVTVDRKNPDGTYTSVYQSEVFFAKKGVINNVFNVSGFVQNAQPVAEKIPDLKISAETPQNIEVNSFLMAQTEVKKKEINLINDYTKNVTPTIAVAENLPIVPVEEKLIESPVKEEMIEAPEKEELLPPKDEQKLL